MIINQVIKGGGGGASITVQLNPVASGVNVYATGGGETSTAVSDSDGMAIVYVKPDTTYTVSADGDYSDKTVAVAKAPILVQLRAWSKYACVEIDTTNSDPRTCVSYPQYVTINNVQYENSCYGFTKASGTGANCLGSDWSEHWLVSKIKPVVSDGASTPTFIDAPKNPANWTTGSEYFTQFDACWYCIETDGNTIRCIIADTETNPDSNRFIKDAFLGADGTTIRNCFHIGCFYSSGTESAIYSNASNTAAQMGIVSHCKGANARGNEYDIASFQQWTYIQLVFVMIYGSLDSQTAHSKGLSNASSSDLTNAPISCSNDYGMAGNSNGTARMAFFWIHDIWGNKLRWLGGAFMRKGSDYYVYVLKGRMAQQSSFDNNAWTSPTSNKANQANMGTKASNGWAFQNKYITKVWGNNAAGFMPRSGGGSRTTYFPDYAYAYLPNSAAFYATRASYANGWENGLFAIRCDMDSTNEAPVSTLSYRGGTL